MNTDLPLVQTPPDPVDFLVPRILPKAHGPGHLTAGGALSSAIAVALELAAKATGLATTFVLAGAGLFVIRAFYSRVQGDAKIDATGVTAPIGPDVSVSSSAPPPLPGLERDDATAGPTLSARPPTLDAALNTVPRSWTTERISDDDGHDYVHVRSPQGGFALVINAAALDSPAPRWLLVAINTIQSDEPG